MEFSEELERSLHRALNYANENEHEYSTLEHLLLALLDDKDALKIFKHAGTDVNILSSFLKNYIEKELGNLVVSPAEGLEEAKPTAGFQRVIQRAVIHVQSSERTVVSGANVLVAIFAERESHAAYFLQEVNLTRYDAVLAIQELRDEFNESSVYNNKELFEEKSDNLSYSIKKVRKKLYAEPLANASVCVALSRLSQLEIEKMQMYKPNSDEEIARKDSIIELLRLFNEFFAIVANHISVFEERNEADNFEKEAAANLITLSDALSKWWNKNHERVVGTAVGMPIFVGAVGFLGSLGLAPIPLATATAATATACFGAGAIENALKIVNSKKNDV